MASICTCGHVGDGVETPHRDMIQPGHGKCTMDGCECVQFTYDGPVAEYTETKEEIWWRKITCPKCGVEKDDLEVMPETGDFGSIDDGLTVVCECGFEFKVVPPQEMKCIHCGESDYLGYEASIDVDLTLPVQMIPKDKVNDQEHIRERFWDQWSDGFDQTVSDAITADMKEFKIGEIPVCAGCGKYQTADGEAPKETVLSEVEPASPEHKCNCSHCKEGESK